MIDTAYVTQGKIAAGSNYFISNIAGDGATWKPITLPANIRVVSLTCRSGNDTTDFTYCEEPVEFHFARTAAPGVNWIAITGISIPIVKETSDIVGYVMSPAGSFISAVGLG